MMRVMRKILKRKVSIVMAVLVILGIAVYGVSAFAEEQTATAETFTVNPNYIYLNPAGMNLGSVDWTSSSADIRLNVTGWKDIHQGTYDPKSGYWYWDATNWEIKDVNTYFFTYGTDWSVIKSKSYYRTEVSSDILATGKVYAQNGTASQQIDSQNVYALKEYTSNAGRSLAFVNMTAGELSGVQAQFSLDSNYDDFTSDQLTALQLSDGKVTVPNDVNGKAYQYVRFIDAQNNAITDSFDISTAISKGGILYYGIRQDSSKTYSEWSQEKKSETTPNVTKLYFNNLSFWTSDDITIQIGSGEPVKVVPDDTATNTLSYNISGTIDKDTIISITKNGVTYRFYPNGTDNLITYSGSNICIKGTYQASSPNTVYFDATLSKLSYAGDVADNSLPLKDAGISYHAWNTETDFTDGDLTKLEDFSDGTHTWSDVYQAQLDKKYSNILFYSSTDGNIPSTPTANKTDDLTIPDGLTNPYLNDYYNILGGDCSVQGQTAQDDRYEYFESSAYMDTMKKWMDVDASASDDGDTAGALGSYNHRNMLDELEASYESYVNTHYTDVPESQKRIEKLCKKKKKEWDKKLEGNLSDTQKQDLSYEKIDDVKNFVVRTLWERCEYSKSASKISDDEDYIERFMFEKKKGDSTAFASAAVVMFRSCGIPARYVVGYAAPANLFSGQADGSYMAVLQDDNAHAWVEIYMPDCGWTPVETTPGFAGTIANLDMPEADTEDTESIADKKDKDADRDGEDTAGTGADMKRIRQLKLLLGTMCGILLVIIAVILRVWYVKRRTLALDKRLSPGDRVRIIFKSFYELLERDGRISAKAGDCVDAAGLDTTRPEFVDAVLAVYPELVRSDFERFMELVLMANYGPDKLEAGDCELAVVMYKRLKKLVARKAVVRGYLSK